MKYLVFLFAIFFTTVSCSNAQSSEKEKVAQAVQTFTDAMSHPETALYSDLVSDALSYGHSSGLVQNKAVFLDDLVNGSFKFLTPAISDQTIEITDNIAIVRHVFTSKFTNKEASGNVNIGNLQIWRNEDGKWRLLARQAFPKSR